MKAIAFANTSSFGACAIAGAKPSAVPLYLAPPKSAEYERRKHR